MDEGNALKESGRYKEARAAYQLALQDEETPSGSIFRRAVTLTNLGLVNRNLGNYSEAEEQYQRALALMEKVHDPLLPEKANVLQNLGVLYYAAGRIDEAS